MYLKSIEVQGFKSFANKIVFDFHNGITGIVGPNGSGKSNVADAVRWVLGEQSAKQLRGGNMQDVIFAGTALRKPLSYAMVSIVMDNSDHQLPIEYEEVTIARKLYRSGESDYLINGNICRLMDIKNLFYDTGIGKEGYSIIGQGQIDKILSGKPDERRELFDEAAGIVKFKMRKNQTVKKLDEERQNLTRVTDILNELEKQIGPLAKQSEVAKEYLKKKEALKTYDINMFLLETARIKAEIASLDEKIKIADDELADSTKEYESTKEQYEAIEVQTDEIDVALERAKRQLNDTTLLKQQLESQIELLKEQINTARMNDEHFATRTAAITEEIKTREEQLAQIDTEKAELDAQIAEKEEEQNKAKGALLEIQNRIAQLEGKVEDDKNHLIELLNNRSFTKAKIQKFDTMLEQIQVRRSELNQRLITAQSNVVSFDEEIKKFENELKEISDSIIDLTEKRGTIEEEIKATEKLIEEKSAKHSELQASYHRNASKLESLKNLTERYDGYGNSIRKVMEKKESDKGILGVVADLIKVDKAYEVAVETALGGSIQNIVTENEETAKRMIGYLKQNKFGRATFLPLTALHDNSDFKQKDALSEKGVIGLASSLVKVDKKYEKMVSHLLGRTIVVENIDHGIALARKYNQSLKIVSLEGDLMNPGGAMTGGAFKNTSNLLSRRREIEDLEKTVAKLSDEMKEISDQIEKAKADKNSFLAKIDEIKESLQSAYVVQTTAKMNLNQQVAKKSEAEALVSQIRTENDDLDAQVKEIHDNHKTIQIELEDSEKEEAEIHSNSGADQKELEETRAKEAVSLQETEQIHLAYAALEQKQMFVTENQIRIHDEINKFNEEMALLDDGRENAVDEIKAKEKEIEELQQTIADSADLFREIGIEIDKYVAEKEELSKKHKEFLSKREDLSKHMAEIDKELFRLNSRKESYEEASEKQINYMWEEYELTYSSAMEIRDENLTDLAFMKKQIQALKNEIKALGSVNVNAIEDYKAVSERYEFLKTQHDDLVEAEATLLKIIEDLDEAMRKQFKEQFEKINIEFDKVFKQLFGGGTGTLELIEDEDVLDAGIRIIAQPPGKKLQNMMQLSGGEKALTAICLLFAIQHLKPSPFCLLDEIEAALDDSNVDRFAKYLHKLTSHTQFIVITHKKGTMTAADRLYGITMQEKGVSALVSVDLIEHELED